VRTDLPRLLGPAAVVLAGRARQFCSFRITPQHAGAHTGESVERDMLRLRLLKRRVSKQQGGSAGAAGTLSLLGVGFCELQL